MTSLNSTKFSFVSLLAIGLTGQFMTGPGYARSIAFTFDDGPEMTDSLGMSPADRNAAILSQLSDAKVEAALFLKCGALNKERLALTRNWGLAGHLVGNHSTSHRNFNSRNVTLEKFIEDFASCHEQIKEMRGFAKFFRFPYLKEGDDAHKRDGFRAFLKSAGYRPAPVSIDTSDWFYNSRLREKIKASPSADNDGLRNAYVAHLLDRAEYYDALSHRVAGRSVSHTLLLHHNLINALFLRNVLVAFKARGWEVISARHAFQDPVYAAQPNVLPAGEGILWSLAKEKGLPNLRYPAEDSIYEKPVLDKLGI